MEPTPQTLFPVAPRIPPGIRAVGPTDLTGNVVIHTMATPAGEDSRALAKGANRSHDRDPSEDPKEDMALKLKGFLPPVEHRGHQERTTTRPPKSSANQNRSKPRQRATMGQTQAERREAGTPSNHTKETR